MVPGQARGKRRGAWLRQANSYRADPRPTASQGRTCRAQTTRPPGRTSEDFAPHGRGCGKTNESRYRPAVARSAGSRPAFRSGWRAIAAFTSGVGKRIERRIDLARAASSGDFLTDIFGQSGIGTVDERSGLGRRRGAFLTIGKGQGDFGHAFAHHGAAAAQYGDENRAASRCGCRAHHCGGPALRKSPRCISVRRSRCRSRAKLVIAAVTSRLAVLRSSPAPKVGDIAGVIGNADRRAGAQHGGNAHALFRARDHPRGNSRPVPP